MTEHPVESDARCAEHGDLLVSEPGGPDMLTMHGRTYCPTCQERFMEALDSLPARRSVIPPGSGDTDA